MCLFCPYVVIHAPQRHCPPMVFYPTCVLVTCTLGGHHGVICHHMLAHPAPPRCLQSDMCTCTCMCRTTPGHGANALLEHPRSPTRSPQRRCTHVTRTHTHVSRTPHGGGVSHRFACAAQHARNKNHQPGHKMHDVRLHEIGQRATTPRHPVETTQAPWRPHRPRGDHTA